MTFVRLSAPDISPVDEMVQVVLVVVLAVVVVPLLAGFGRRGRRSQGLSTPRHRVHYHRLQLRRQQAFRLWTLVRRYTIREQPSRPRPTTTFARATLRIFLVHFKTGHISQTNVKTISLGSFEVELSIHNISQTLKAVQASV